MCCGLNYCSWRGLRRLLLETSYHQYGRDLSSGIPHDSVLSHMLFNLSVKPLGDIRFISSSRLPELFGKATLKDIVFPTFDKAQLTLTDSVKSLEIIFDPVLLLVKQVNAAVKMFSFIII